MDNELQTERDDAAKDVGKYSALEAVALSEGGKMIAKTAQEDVDGIISDLTIGYKTLPDIELRALCADLATKLALLNTFKNASANKDNALVELKRIDKILKP